MNSSASKFKMSVTIPKMLFFASSSLVNVESAGEDAMVSMRSTSFIIRPHIHVNSSVARDLRRINFSCKQPVVYANNKLT